MFPLLGLIGCSDEIVGGFSPDCDEIAFPLGVNPDPGLVEQGFEVECATGWGHNIAATPASDTIELPGTFSQILPHPSGGWLVGVTSISETWKTWLDSHDAEYGLFWVDDDFNKIHWATAGEYYWWIVVEGADGPEIWTREESETESRLQRIEIETGTLVEEISTAVDTVTLMHFANAWDPADGAWITKLELLDDDVEVIELQRMKTFGQIEVVRTTQHTDRGWPGARMYPTPDGGVLWALGSDLEAVGPDSSSRWTSTGAPRLAVDAAGNYVRVDAVPEQGNPQLIGLNIERRVVADNALLWSHSYHRYEFADAPVLGEVDNPRSTWLIDVPSGAIAMDDGYRLLISTAYPAKACHGQPLVLAVDFDGAVQWGHMVDVCGSVVSLAHFGARSAADGYVIQGRTQDRDNPTNGDSIGGWLRVFE